MPSLATILRFAKLFVVVEAAQVAGHVYAPSLIRIARIRVTGPFTNDEAPRQQSRQCAGASLPPIQLVSSSLCDAKLGAPPGLC